MLDFENDATFEIDLGQVTDVGKNYQPQIDDLKQDVNNLDITTQAIKKDADKAVQDSSNAIQQSTSALNSSTIAQATAESVKSDLNNKADKTSIPTLTSQLNNDSNFVDDEFVQNAVKDKVNQSYVDTQDQATLNSAKAYTDSNVVKTYSDLPDKPKINGVEVVGDKPLSEFEGKYELIEKGTIDVDAEFSRTQTPQGKPYKFKAIKIIIQRNESDQSIQYWYANIKNSNNSFQAFQVQLMPTHTSCEATGFRNMGIWKGLVDYYDKAFFRATRSEPYNPSKNLTPVIDGYIYSVNTYLGTKKGTKYEIWGVWDDE